MHTGPLGIVPARHDRPTLVDLVCQGWPDAPLPVVTALADADSALAEIARALGLPPTTPPADVAAVTRALLGRVSRG